AAAEAARRAPRPEPMPFASANPPTASAGAAEARGAFQSPLRDLFHESPTRRRWRDLANTPLYQPSPPRERITQLIGSLLLSLVACLVISLVVMILRGETPDPTQYAWLASTTILGSWAVLIPAKYWEGTRGDTVRRRFTMLVIGLAYGMVAYAILT